jgi:hypothetical protein
MLKFQKHAYPITTWMNKQKIDVKNIKVIKAQQLAGPDGLELWLW